MKRKKLHTIDTPYQKVLNTYIDEVLEEERKLHDSDVESFEEHAEKVRGELTERFLNFHESFLSGYELLVRERKKRKQGPIA